jgi:hypothetical protein
MHDKTFADHPQEPVVISGVSAMARRKVHRSRSRPLCGGWSIPGPLELAGGTGAAPELGLSVDLPPRGRQWRSAPRQARVRGRGKGLDLVRGTSRRRGAREGVCRRSGLGAQQDVANTVSKKVAHLKAHHGPNSRQCYRP